MTLRVSGSGLLCGSSGKSISSAGGVGGGVDSSICEDGCDSPSEGRTGTEVKTGLHRGGVTSIGRVWILKFVVLVEIMWFLAGNTSSGNCTSPPTTIL